ncbi:MAG: hypothetical protein DRO67_02865 [Candidatus Asgardarchaeum californiense]|nr:MAG: hypothetical protein DRO67_02865 [Candidatus Asgardarchaeum californiense]
MEEITTISISKSTKKLLEQKKGKNKTWDMFFKELIEEKERLESIIAAMELENKFTKEIEEAVKGSSKEFRRTLKFKEIEL